MLWTDELVAALCQGDEAALSELYDRYGTSVYGLALRITGDPGMAEEISLDAFWQLWRQAGRFNGNEGSVQGWLLKVARTRAIDRVRARGAAKRTRAEDPTAVNHVEQPDETAELAERQQMVRQAMTTLSPNQRTALELAYYEGLSHSQIAERLNEPLGTVKTRIRQAMNVLRQTIKPTLLMTS